MGNIFKSIGSALGSVGKSMASPLVGAVGSIVGSSMNNKANLKAVREQNAAQMELAKYKYEKDLEMWNRQNEYNSPAAQMARFAQAGLNPNFMYGGGNSGNASSMPQYDTPTISAYTQQDYGIGAAAMGSVDLYNRALSLEYENRLKESSIAKFNADAAGQLVKNAGYIIDNSRKATELGILDKYGAEQAKAAWQQTIANVKHLNADTMLTYHKSATEKAREDLVIRQADHELDKMSLTRLQKAKVLADISYIQEHIQVLIRQRDLMQYELDTNPSVSQQSQLKSINAAIAIAQGQWESSSGMVTYNKIIDILNKATGVVGSALSGYKTYRSTP